MPSLTSALADVYQQLGADGTVRTLLLLAVVHLVAVMSPGPDFALVSRYALTVSRRSAVLAAIGLTLGITGHLTWVLAGLSQLALHAPSLLRLMRWGGAGYLAYLGVKSLKAGIADLHKPVPERQEGTSAPPEARRVLLQGFITNLLNPKAIVYFMSLTAQFVTPEVTPVVRLMFGTEVLAISLGWFAGLGYVLGSVTVRSRIYGATPWINCVTGSLFLLFACRILLVP